jgi:hypothetical protein
MNTAPSGALLSDRRVSQAAPWAMLARKLVVVIASIVLLVTLGVYFGLASHEREVLVSGRVATATTVLRYLAVSLAPEVSFGDDKSISADLVNLSRDQDLLGVEVWVKEAAGLRLLGSSGRAGEAWPGPERAPAVDDGAAITEKEFTVTTRIVGAEGEPLGVVRAAFRSRG